MENSEQPKPTFSQELKVASEKSDANYTKIAIVGAAVAAAVGAGLQVEPGHIAGAQRDAISLPGQVEKATIMPSSDNVKRIDEEIANIKAGKVKHIPGYGTQPVPNK